MKNYRYFFYFLTIAFQFTTYASFPEFIDLRKDTINQTAMESFNSAPEIIPVIAQIKKISKLRM